MPAETDLSKLVERIAKRDEDALGTFYDRTSARVFGLALRILGDRELAEEATLDVFAHVWEHAARFDGSRGSPLAWLAVLTRSRAVDRARALGRIRAEADVDDGDTPLEAAEAARPGLAVDMRGALEELPAELRRPIELAYFEGLSYKESARRLGAPEGTIKSRIRQGMSALRAKLGGAYEDCP